MYICTTTHAMTLAMALHQSPRSLNQICSSIHTLNKSSFASHKHHLRFMKDALRLDSMKDAACLLLDSGKCSLPIITCKASPTHGGRVGRQDKQHGTSLLGIKSLRIPSLANGDFAKALSSLLPYVVVATAIAALVHPPTFTWYFSS